MAFLPSLCHFNITIAEDENVVTKPKAIETNLTSIDWNCLDAVTISPFWSKVSFQCAYFSNLIKPCNNDVYIFIMLTAYRKLFKESFQFCELLIIEQYAIIVYGFMFLN